MADSEGLPLAYRRIRQMGGFFHSRLEQDGVAAFEIYLPRIDVAQAGIRTSRIADPAILLIEPDPDVRRVLSRHFEQHGYNVLSTDDVPEAVLLARLYPGSIPLAIAHPEESDWTRTRLSHELVSAKPGIRVKLVAGYWQECGEPGSEAWDSTCRYLTKWDLLEWANRAIVSCSGAC